MNKRITIEEAVSKIKDGDTIMVGGFLAVGTPESLIDALVAKGVKDLTLICNDTGFVDRGVGKMVVNKQFKKIIASHIGTNRETGRQMVAGETEVILTPQGTLVEQIRAGGNGIGGFLVKTGLGTEVQKGKQIINVDGEDYLLEKPMRADVAILFANKADENGNLWYHGTTRNFIPLWQPRRTGLWSKLMKSFQLASFRQMKSSSQAFSFTISCKELNNGNG